MTTDNRKLNLETNLDTTGIKAGAQDAKAALKDLAQSAVQSGKEAAKGIDSIGDGAAGVAAKVDDSARAYGRFEAEIRRKTASIKAALEGTGVAGEIANKAMAQGLDTSRLSAGLQNLQALERQKAALSAPQSDVSPQGDALLANLREQIRLYGRTSDEVLKYRAAQAGVGAEASNLILQLQNIKAATQAKAAADEAAAAAAQKQAAALRQTASAQQAFLSSLREQVATKGLDASGLLSYRAAQLGVSKEADQLIAQLGKSRDGLGKVGISAGQTAAALRGVPAQFTDIVTSLQGGQAPITVLLQQGGQLKDMFGGVGPAAKALGGYVAGLINPFTVAAAAAAALTYAFVNGRAESEGYAKALILSGNAAGVTARQMGIMAKNIDGMVGTQHQAAEALTALASTGQIAGANLEKFGATAVRINRTVGTSVDDVAKTFAELGKDPVKASEKLNESMNYLTLGLYEQIRALQEHGRESEAAALAQKSYSDEMDKRTSKLEANLGIIQRSWMAVAGVAKEGWDQILGIGRPEGPGEEAKPRWSAALLVPALLPGEVARAARGAFNDATTSQDEKDSKSETIRLLRRQESAEADLARVKATTHKEAIAAAKENEAINKAAMSNQEKLTAALEKYRANNARINAARALDGKATISAEQVAREEANLREQYKDKKGATPRAFQDDAATKMLEGLRQQEASLKEQLNTDEKLTASEKDRAKFVQLVADLKTKGTLTADQKSLLAAQDTLKAQHDKNVAIEAEIVLKKEAAELDKKRIAFEKQMQGITLSYQSGNDSRAEQYDRTLSTVGLGTRARQEVEAQKSIRKEFDRYVLQANKQASDASTDKFDAFATDAYKNKIVELKGALNDALAAQQDYYAKEKAAREDWSNGAKSALADYIDYVNDAASRAREVVATTLNGATDGITGYLMGDKGSSFKEVGTNIARQITKGFVEQGITKPIAEALQNSLKDSDSIISKVLGGLTGSADKAGGGNFLSGILGTGKDAGASTAAAAAATANTSLATAATSAAAALAALTSAAASSAAVTGGASAGKLASLFSTGGTASSGFGTGAAFGNQDFGGYFANGGDPPIGRVSVVGERGPELFVPKQAGTIIPNSALGGGGTVVHINQTFAEGTTRKTADMAAMQASRAIQRAQRNT